LATKYQIEVKVTDNSRFIPRSGLYRSLAEAQTAAMKDIRAAALVVITSFAPGSPCGYWHMSQATGKWEQGRPDSVN